jgi:hypothetical protein
MGHSLTDVGIFHKACSAFFLAVRLLDTSIGTFDALTGTREKNHFNPTANKGHNSDINISRGLGH